MEYVIYRIRHFKDNIFLEVYVTGVENALKLPTQIPTRFLNRIEKKTLLGPKFECLKVHSEQKSCGLRTYKNIISDGIWIVESDTIPKGGIRELNIPYSISIFGIPIVSQIPWGALYTIEMIDTKCVPIVVYHGTEKCNVKSILQDTLRPSFGMFGNCVYFGSFWKAYRFASFTQDYKARDGAIFRCLAFWKKMYIRNMHMSICICASCVGLQTLSDHAELWTSTKCDALFLFPSTLNGRWFSKSEEYAAKSSDLVLLDSVAYTKKQDTYNSSDRSLVVI
jgi:hypothetical protein